MILDKIQFSDTYSLKLKLIYDRQSVGQSVLVSSTHLGPATKLFFLLEILFTQLRVCYFVAPSLTRGRVCNLLYNCFWALPEQSLLGEVSQSLQPYFTVSFETPPTWRARFPYLYPPGTGWPSYTQGIGFPFCRLLRLAGLRWRYSNPPPHGSTYSCAKFLDLILNESTVPNYQIRKSQQDGMAFSNIMFLANFKNVNGCLTIGVHTGVRLISGRPNTQLVYWMQNHN
jgi:hypothetical protein